MPVRARVSAVGDPRDDRRLSVNQGDTGFVLAITEHWDSVKGHPGEGADSDLQLQTDVRY
jgi:hypothetical protein